MPSCCEFLAIRSATMRAALEGMIVMDETSVGLKFDPWARIFADTRGAVREKRGADPIIPEARCEAAPESQGDSSQP